MTHTVRPIKSLALLALVAVSTPSPTVAQGVLVRVMGAEAAEPLFGALAHLVDDQGETVRTALTDERGRALFVGIDPASYRVRAEMIGMATGETEPFVVEEGATVTRELSLESSAIHLEGIEVSTESNRCRSRPSGEGLVVANIWEEARKALSAAAFTDQRGLYRYETVRYERDLHPDTKAVLHEEERRREGYMRVPFESLPAEDLVENGFVQRDGTDRVYHAPDAGVLLSDAFLDTHCFRLEDVDDEAGLIGLGFEPTRENRDTPDIAGTLWLDRSTAELRWLDFRYWNLGEDVPQGEASGRVEFRRMPAGTWIVPEWWIRMPAVRVRIGRNDLRRPEITGYRQTGGRVLEVHEAGGRAIEGATQSGGIEGVVVDAFGSPLQGVRVGVVGSNQQVFTNAEGRFTITGLTDGVYQVRFMEPDLEAIGYIPPSVSREVIRGELSYVEYHMPTLRDAVLAACEADERPEGTVALIGSVLEERRGRPIAGATVRVQWSSFDTALQLRAIREDISIRETTTGTDGSFRFCGLPAGAPLTVVSEIDGVESSPETLRIYGDEVGAAHVIRR